MELRHLRYFEAAAREMHFGRAALQLHISQPALSKQIKELEEELGLSLFVRYKKAVALTDAGKVFLEETRKTLQQAEAAIYKAQLVRKGEYGELKIGYDGSTLSYLLTPVLKELKAKAPNLKVTLREGCNQTLSDLLKEEVLDIAFMFGPVEGSELSFEPIYEEEYLIALPAHHPLVYQESISMAQLSDENFILHPRYENPTKYDQIVRLCQQHGFTPKVVHEHASVQARISLVASGMGVCLAVETFSRLPQANIVFVRLEESLPKMQMVVAWKRSKMRPLLKHVLKAVHTLPLQQHMNTALA